MVQKDIKNDIIVREVKTEKDFDAIHDICLKAWAPVYDYRKEIMNDDIFTSIYADGERTKALNVREWCADNPEFTRVAVMDNKVVGFITWQRYNSETIELCNNAVDPSAHRRGIGSTLYNWFLTEMKTKGYLYTFVFTGLDVPHKPAMMAYKKMGFESPIETVRLYKKL
tara:strand:+ start:6947 stop:7453 length:507 start_codon:yes stop_codon:yes gene_type:complete